MNSTTSPLNPPIPSSDVATIAGAWATVGFSFIGCGAILCKVIVSYSSLRVSCLVVNFLSCLVVAVANVLRISSTIPEDVFNDISTIFLMVFLDLLTIVTYTLGGKFYPPKKRINNLFWMSLATGLLTNLAMIASLVLQALLMNEVATCLSNVARFMFLLAGICAFMYMFYPLMNANTGMDEMPSAVVAVGMWYFSGLVIVVSLDIFCEALSTVYPWRINKSIDMNLTTAKTFLRSTFLVFHSFPPPVMAVTAIRRRFFPNPFGATPIELRMKQAALPNENMSTTRLTKPRR